MTDGPVFTSAKRGEILYLGGGFNYIGPRTGCVVSLEKGSGRVFPVWPEVDGSINAVAPDGVGGWFVGGSFLSVGGHPRTRLAHFRADGSMDHWAPVVDGEIHALEVTEGRVLIGGQFVHVAGMERLHLAAVDKVTGEVLPWNPSTDNFVYAMALAEGQLFVGGDFDTVNGEPRSRLAALDLDTGELTDWMGSVSGSSSRYAFVQALKASGNTLFVGGAFREAGGEPRSNACAFDLRTADLLPWAPSMPSVVRALTLGGEHVIVGRGVGASVGDTACEIAAVDPVLGRTFAFRIPADQDVRAVHVEAGTVYAGGSFLKVAGARRLRAAAIDLATGTLLPWAPNFAGPVITLASSGGDLVAAGAFGSAGGVERLNFGAISLSTREATDWAPRADLQVNSLLVGERSIYAGGAFRWAGGFERQHIVELDLATGAATDWNPVVTARDYASVFAMALRDDLLYAVGHFTHAGGLGRQGAAAIDVRTGAVSAWDPALQGIYPSGYAVVVSGNTVYVGGNFDQAGGVPRKHLVALDAVTAAVGDWDPAPDYEVRALALDGGRLFVGGGFWTIGGADRRCLAEVDTTTGLATAWNPHVTQESAAATVMSIIPDADRIHVSGQFCCIGAKTRNNVARLGRGEGPLSIWDAQVGWYLYVTTLAPHEGTVWIGGQFNRVAGHTVTGLAHVLSDLQLPTGTPLIPSDATMVIGDPHELSWTAQDDVDVRGVDIHLSRAGPDGPWEPIAFACKNDGQYLWTPHGPSSDDVCVRFDIRDFAGNVTQVKQAGLRIAETSTPIPGASSLAPLRPNPAIESASFSYTLERARAVRITLLDMQGRIRETVVDRTESAGAHFAVVRTGNLSPGMYWLRMESEGFSESHRFVVLR